MADVASLISWNPKGHQGFESLLRNQVLSGVDVMVALEFSKLFVSVRVRDAAPVSGRGWYNGSTRRCQRLGAGSTSRTSLQFSESM